MVATVLILLHARQLLARDKTGNATQGCWPYGEDVLVVGIVAYGKTSAGGDCEGLLIILLQFEQELCGSSSRYLLL